MSTKSRPAPMYAHSLPAHKEITASPLSQEAPVQNYRGFQNLVMLLLFVNNIRLMVENYLKYGLLIRLPGTTLSWPDLERMLLSMLFLPVALSFAILIEWLAARQCAALLRQAHPSKEDAVVLTTTSSRDTTPRTRRRRASSGATSDAAGIDGVPGAVFSDTWVLVAHILNLLFVLIVPNLYAYKSMKHPLLISVPCTNSVVLAMKLASWMFVNRDLRKAYLAGNPIEDYGKDIVYPKNLTVGNLLYFHFAPTLCYQPSYPRTPKFRWSFFLKRLLELLTFLGMMYFLVEQYVRPTLHNSLRPFHSLHFPAIFERILKLSIPSVYFWLIMFYAVFHCYLNLIAESMRFGDRNFYRPWWNARTIGEYWRLWNLPVYLWFKRHIYVPMITKHKMPPLWAGALAFTVSAVGHEIMIGIPTGVVEGWAFGGMMGQLPLIWLTDWLYHLEKKRRQQRNRTTESDPIMDEELSSSVNVGSFGNYLFWLSFCILGQPLSVILYYRAWYMREHPELVAQAVRGY